MSNAGKFGTNGSVYRQGKQVSSDFKLTVLGPTPSDWDVATLEALSEKIMVGIASAATHAYRDRGVPFLRNQNILPNKLDVSDILYVSPEYEVSFQNKRLKAGDLLTARTGYPGTTCMIPDAFEGAQSFTTLITRLKTDRVLPEFVCAFMNSEQGQKFFELNQIGGGQKNVNSSILKTFPLPIPQLPEQTAIANALSDVDALIQELEKLIAKKQAIKTATMQQLLTGRTRLPAFAYEKSAHHPDGRKKGYKPSELGEIPEDWECTKMGDLAKIQRGASPRPIDSPIWFDRNSSVGWLRISDLTRTNKFLTETTQSLSELGVSHSRFVPKNNLVMSICATVGKPIITKRDLCIHDGFVVFNGLTVNQDFMYYVLKELEDEWSKQGQTGSQMNLNTDLINGTNVCIPNLTDEQVEIALILSDMDEEVQALEQRVNKTRQIKQGMMQELLTGKTRLV